MEFNIRTNIDRFAKGLNDFAKSQVPFATAQALTAVTKIAAQAEQANEKKVLDRPKPFTTGAVFVIGARKSNLTARLVMKDRTAAYLEPYQFGGKNKLNSKALLKPVGSEKDLDQFGNLPRNLVKRLLARSDVFVGPVKTKAGIVNGVWQRVQAEGAARPTTTYVNARGKVVTRKVQGYVPASRDDRRLRLLIRFTDAHSTRPRLDWFSVAHRSVTHSFQKEFGRALARAIATANKS